MNTTPSGTASSSRAESSTTPRRVATRTGSPGSMPSWCSVARDRSRLERIEHARAARHRAGVPMLELPAGGEDERILGIRHLVGRGVFRRYELRQTIRAWNAGVEHDIAPRNIRPRGWIGDVI